MIQREPGNSVLFILHCRAFSRLTGVSPRRKRHEDSETMKSFVIAFVAALLPPTGAFTQDSGQERVAVGNRITLVAGSASGSHCNLSPARAAGVRSYSDWRLSRGTRVGYRWPMPIRKDSAWSGTRPCRDNVVFAATTEVYLIALDAINGRLLWRSDTDALRVAASPISYAVDAPVCGQYRAQAVFPASRFLGNPES